MTTPKTVYVTSSWSGDAIPKRNKISTTYMKRLLHANNQAHLLLLHIIYDMKVNDKGSYLDAISADITDIRALYPYRTGLNKLIRYLTDHNLIIKAAANKQSHVYYINPSVFHVMNRQQVNDYCDSEVLFGDVLL